VEIARILDTNKGFVPLAYLGVGDDYFITKNTIKGCYAKINEIDFVTSLYTGKSIKLIAVKYDAYLPSGKLLNEEKNLVQVIESRNKMVKIRA
jgi:hypothetical protein